MGGIAFGQLVGYLLDHGFGYGVVFTLAGTFSCRRFRYHSGYRSRGPTAGYLERKLSFCGSSECR